MPSQAALCLRDVSRAALVLAIGLTVGAVYTYAKAQVPLSKALDDIPVFKINPGKTVAFSRGPVVEVIADMEVDWSPVALHRVKYLVSEYGRTVMFDRHKFNVPKDFGRIVVCVDWCSEMPERIDALDRKYLLVGTVYFTNGRAPMTKEQPLDDEHLRWVSHRGVTIYSAGHQANAMMFRIPVQDALKIKDMEFYIKPWTPAHMPR